VTTPSDILPITQFKATCLAVLKRVERTGKPVVVTRFGKPIAEIVPPRSRKRRRKSWLGCMAGTATIHGDIVGPIIDTDEIEAYQGIWEPSRKVGKGRKSDKRAG